MEKLEKQDWCKTAKKKKKKKLKYTSKPRYMWEKIFDNDLAAICKSKVILTLNKPAYVGICILDLSKVLYWCTCFTMNIQLKTIIHRHW